MRPNEWDAKPGEIATHINWPKDTWFQRRRVIVQGGLEPTQTNLPVQTPRRIPRFTKNEVPCT